MQASCAGLGIAAGGLIRDGMAFVALHDGLGATLAYRATGYGTVYSIEILLLLATMVVLGPVIGLGSNFDKIDNQRFGLSEFPT